MQTESNFNWLNDQMNKKRKRFIILDGSMNLLDNTDMYESDDALVDDQDNKKFELLDDEGKILRKIQNKNTHKILITEEKMSDALRDLQIEMDSEDSNETKEEEEQKQPDSNPEFHLTDELKTSMKILNREQNEFSQKLFNEDTSFREYEMNKHMQIIPWLPNEIQINAKSSINDQSINDKDFFLPSSSEYKVEEPTEKRNNLKRTFAQANKITIEEIKPSDQFSSITDHYLVELASDENDKVNSRVPTCNHHFSITEMPQSKSTKNRKVSKEELMEL